MFTEIITFVAFVAVAQGQTDWYPAGHTSEMFDDNSFVDSYNSDPGYYAAPVASAPASGYPAGVFSSLPASVPTARPLAKRSARLYADGFVAASCPNYPYCIHDASTMRGAYA